MKWKVVGFFSSKRKSSIDVDLDSWVTGSCSNTTLVALVTAHFDVTLVTPASSPAKIDANVRKRIFIHDIDHYLFLTSQ